MIDVYKDHLDGQLIPFDISTAEIKTSKNLNQIDENREKEEENGSIQANYKCGRNFSFLISPRSFKKQHPEN